MQPGHEARAGVPAVVEGLTVIRLLSHTVGCAVVHRDASKRRIVPLARLFGQHLELGHRVACQEHSRFKGQGSRLLDYLIREMKFVAEHIPHKRRQ